jgi:hypothetical protein
MTSWNGLPDIERKLERMKVDALSRLVLFQSFGALDALSDLSHHCDGKPEEDWKKDVADRITVSTQMSAEGGPPFVARFLLGACYELLHTAWRCRGLDSAGWKQYITRRVFDIGTALSNFTEITGVGAGAMLPKHPDAWVRWVREEGGEKV